MAVPTTVLPALTTVNVTVPPLTVPPGLVTAVESVTCWLDELKGVDSFDGVVVVDAWFTFRVWVLVVSLLAANPVPPL